MPRNSFRISIPEYNKNQEKRIITRWILSIPFQLFSMELDYRSKEDGQWRVEWETLRSIAFRKWSSSNTPLTAKRALRSR